MQSITVIKPYCLHCNLKNKESKPAAYIVTYCLELALNCGSVMSLQSYFLHFTFTVRVWSCPKPRDSNKPTTLIVLHLKLTQKRRSAMFNVIIILLLLFHFNWSYFNFIHALRGPKEFKYTVSPKYRLQNCKEK